MTEAWAGTIPITALQPNVSYIAHTSTYSSRAVRSTILFCDDRSCSEKLPINDGINSSITFEHQSSRNHPTNGCISISDERRSSRDDFTSLSQESKPRPGSFAKPSAARTSVSPIEAIQAISRLRGGTQSQLMLCDDDNLWVVKFKNNPQHLRTLANELIATRMAEAIGLSVPTTGVVNVSQALIAATPQLYVNKGPNGREMFSSGLQSGSKFAGGLMPRQVNDDLPDEELFAVNNFDQFAGMLAFDKWTSNNDRRQAIYCRKEHERGHRIVFIDQGDCFNGGKWTFPNAPLEGAFPRNGVYSAVCGWESFEPWLSRIEQFSRDSLWEIAESVPPEWYGAIPFK